MCAREMGDPQLALFLGRLMATPQQPLLPQLVDKELLPSARDEVPNSGMKHHEHPLLAAPGSRLQAASAGVPTDHSMLL